MRLPVRLIRMRRVRLPGQTQAALCWLQCFQAVVLYRSGFPPQTLPTIINRGSTTATSCGVTLLSNIPAIGFFQITDPFINQLTGAPNTPVDIPAGDAQSFFVSLTPTQAFVPTDVQMSFDCTNTDPAPIASGLNTLLLSASVTPVPDIFALAASLTNDGIVNIPGTIGTGAFSVATMNLGASGSITVSADTGSAILPVNIFLCETNPANGQCISGIGSSVTTTQPGLRSRGFKEKNWRVNLAV